MPRPNIVGKLVRRIDMHHASSGKNKDYRITVAEERPSRYRVYTEHGPAGKLNQGKEQTPSPVSLTSALHLADQLRDAKINQADSYRVIEDKRMPSSEANTPAPTPPVRTHRPSVSAENLSDVCKVRLASMF